MQTTNIHLVKMPTKYSFTNSLKVIQMHYLHQNEKILVLLNRIKDPVDAQLIKQQAGFRKERSCINQTANLWIIVEQLIEWNSPLCINFLDCEKVFDSVDWQTLWSLLGHYGGPEKIVIIIRHSYDGLHCKTVHGGQLTDPEVKTGVR